MGDEETGRSGQRAERVTNDDNLTPTQRFERAIERRDALIRDREQQNSAGQNHEKRRRVMKPVSAE
jgi:hypothetical protein